MPSRNVDLLFPLAGLHKKWGYQKQPPYSTPDCLNVRPTDVIKGRRRGGSRPGLSKSHYTQLGSGNPVRMLSAVTVVENNGQTFWADYFDGASLAAHWAYTIGTAPSILPDNLAGISYANSGGVMRTAALSGMVTSSPYVLEMLIVPYNGAHHGTYRIFFGTAVSTSPFTTGCMLELVLPDAVGTFSGSLKRYSGGSVAESYLLTNGTLSAATPGWLRVIVNGTTITAYWQDQLLCSQSLSSLPGNFFGFGAECTQAGGICLIDTFRATYTTNDGSQNARRLLVASSNGSLYKEEYNNTLIAVSTALTLASDRMLQAAERLQKLYIADNGVMKATGTDGVVTAGVLDAASMGSTWASVAIDTDDDVVEIVDVTGATGGFTAGVYEITTIHASNGLTLNGVTGSCTTCTFRVWRCPKIYDPKAGTLTKWLTTAGKGYIPTGCEFVFVYRDKLVLAAPPTAPHAFFESRTGDPLDFDYGADDTDDGRAVNGVNVEGGQISGALTAAFAIGDDYACFATENSIFIQRGNLTQGAALSAASRDVGIVGGRAWCLCPDGTVVFMSRAGLFAMPPGGGTPAPISRDLLPEEMLRLDSKLYYVQLNFDIQAQGIHIFITAKESTLQYHYFFDWEAKGFWPFSLSSTHEPTATLSHSGNCADDCAVILGCRDGYLRRFRLSAERDDSTAFNSYALYGPIAVGNGDADGLLAEIHSSVGVQSGDIAWALYTGETAEEAAQALTAFDSGTWTAEGLNYREHVRCRGQSICIKISNGHTGRAWTLERMMGRIESQGRSRK